MTSISQQVLSCFEQGNDSFSIPMLAQRLNITEMTLQGILDYWVRKGKLREVHVDANSCHRCHIQKACPFVVSTPRYYERIREDVPASEVDAICRY